MLCALNCVKFELNRSFLLNATTTYAMETDQEIASRMRCENFEQFQTLVRMHLSFELDLNTDAVE